MPGRNNISKLKEGLTPARRADIERHKQAMAAECGLTEIREAAGLTQIQAAAAMGTSQSVLSRLERAEDMRLSSLRRFAEAMGMTLEVSMRMPDGHVYPLDLDKLADPT